MHDDEPSERGDGRRVAPLVVAALGVVYGDIGTSPLYAVRECFSPLHGVAPAPDNVLGVVSLVLWSLILIISIKYALFMLRADNQGEGGILALMALCAPEKPGTPPKGAKRAVVWLGLFGAALLYGDGMITPAISVLSAVEGIGFVTPVLEPVVVPVTVAILVALFLLQKRGTADVGAMFGRVTLVWFVVLASLGVASAARTPEIFAALDPRAGLRFLEANGEHGLLVLGSVFLVVTGGEALYADLGHFGRRPIRWGWYGVVLPALALNYVGQGALLLREPGVDHPFFRLAPGWALLPLVVLATLATSIASQAMISGAFSITMQAVQLGYSPRFPIAHTSSEERGQIYIPPINWLLLASAISLVVGFGSSSSLAAAYGIAVSLTMMITTLLFYRLLRFRWGWGWLGAGALVVSFGTLEAAFLLSNLAKITHGGWFPLVVGATIFLVFETWKTGRRLLAERMRARAGSLPMDIFLQSIRHGSAVRVPGVAVYMTGSRSGVPIALLHNLKHNKVLHERVVLLTVTTEDVPRVPNDDRVSVEDIGDSFHRVIARYGFLEKPDIPRVLAIAELHGLSVAPQETTFVLGRETLVVTSRPGMAEWRKRLFVLLSRNALAANEFYRIPPDRVIEVGVQLEL